MVARAGGGGRGWTGKVLPVGGGRSTTLYHATISCSSEPSYIYDYIMQAHPTLLLSFLAFYCSAAPALLYRRSVQTRRSLCVVYAVINVQLYSNVAASQ